MQQSRVSGRTDRLTETIARIPRRTTSKAVACQRLRPQCGGPPWLDQGDGRGLAVAAPVKFRSGGSGTHHPTDEV